MTPVHETSNDDTFSPGSTTRALSVAAVEDASIEAVYHKLAAVYDWMFGPVLQVGRLAAIKRLPLRPGDKVLEVGVGTGINATLYPDHVSVTGIDFAAEMLGRAESRLAAQGRHNVQLVRMDAAALEFPDDSFDVVYAPYVISVVSDPVKVAREMRRVCRRGGHFAFLNHFLSKNRMVARAERLISPLTVHAGFKTDVDLSAFLAQAELKPTLIERVNVPRISTLITCIKD